MFENLKAALAAVGGGFEHVVKLNNYLIDIDDLPIFREVRDRYLPNENKPASTTLVDLEASRAPARCWRSRRSRSCRPPRARSGRGASPRARRAPGAR